VSIKAIKPNKAINLTVLRGECSAGAEVRELDSGRRLATVPLRVRRGAEPATSVPVTVWDPPAWLEAVDAGDELVVLGRVRRRFFQTASGLGAKVEVEAYVIAKGTDRRRLGSVLRRAHSQLEALME